MVWTYLQLPLGQWGAGNVYLLAKSRWKVNIAKNLIFVMGFQAWYAKQYFGKVKNGSHSAKNRFYADISEILIDHQYLKPNYFKKQYSLSSFLLT